MSALTIGTNVVKDGNGTAVTGGVQTYTDPNRSNAQGAVVAIVGADGTIFSFDQNSGNKSAQTLRVVIATDQPALTNSQPVTLTSLAKTSQITVTRPANTTAYTAGDVVGGAITFTNAVPAAGEFFITDADLRLDITAIPSGMTSFRLYMYNVTPPSALADNAAWDLPSGDRASFLGYVDYGTVVDLGSTCYVQAWGLNKRMQALSTSLFGYLVTNGGFTPAANSEVYTPRIATVPA